MASEPYYVSPGDRLTAGWMNAVVGAVKRRNNSTGRKLQFAGGNSEICPFGELYVDTDVNPAKQKIRGGVVIVGDKTFNVPGHPVNEDNNRDVLVFFRIPFSVNMDDDSQFLLPGVKTSTWTPKFEELANSGSTNYPDSSFPTVPTAVAELIIPLGNLIVKDKIASFSPKTGCGVKVVQHCGGNIFFTTDINFV